METIKPVRFRELRIPQILKDKKFLVGGRISYADICVASALHGISKEFPDIWSKVTSLGSFLELINQRPLSFLQLQTTAEATPLTSLVDTVLSQPPIAQWIANNEELEGIGGIEWWQ